jgi:hypothetical protein
MKHIVANEKSICPNKGIRTAYAYLHVFELVDWVDDGYEYEYHKWLTHSSEFVVINSSIL